MIQPLVSIIVPSFNQAIFIEQCLCSILAQDYSDIEIIVIDGGSTDGSVEIIRRYQDRLAYWVSETDNGQSHAINKGFQRAQGDIVAWLNSDDVYFPTAVSVAVQQFQKNKNLSLFYGQCVYIDECGNFLRYFSEIEPWNKKRLLNFSDFIMQPTTFFRREKLYEIGLLDEALHYGMDWDLWCKLSCVGDVHFEPNVIAANREYGTTKTKSGGWVRLKELLKIQQRHMTGFWPHAFFGLCATEVKLKAEQSTSLLASIFLRSAAYTLLFCAPLAVIQNRKLASSRVLYGFNPHSSFIPDGNATIYLPLVENASEMIFTVRTTAGNTIMVETFDGSQSCTSSGEKAKIVMPVSEATRAKGFGYGLVQFRSQQNLPVTGEVFSVMYPNFSA